MDLQRMCELGHESLSLWYSLVLVFSFTTFWKVFIAAGCYVQFFIATSIFAFNIDSIQISIVSYSLDFFYLLDVLFLLSYLRNEAMRKLKSVRVRHWAFILVDIVSLIPIQLGFAFFYISEDKNKLILKILLQNKTLRLYRVFLLEATYMNSILSPWKYHLLIFFSYMSKSCIISHTLTCIWFNVEKKVSCDPALNNCYLWYEMNMLCVITQGWSGPEEMFSSTPEKIIVMVGMILTVLLLYAFIFPYRFYFTLLHSVEDSVYYSKQLRLKKFIRNMNLKEDIALRVFNYFRYNWAKGDEDEDVGSMLESVPFAELKDIFADIYWEAFRHSYIFKDTSTSFKRTLSLTMSTEYHNDGEIIYYKGQERKNMMYLVQGILQIMADENDESPLLSFSSGTVIGEFSLFLWTSSPCIVKCKGFCELQILNCRGVVLAMMSYPKDKNIIFQRLYHKIEMAKHTQWRKVEFKRDEEIEIMSVAKTNNDSVKWLKTQWRHIFQAEARHLEVVRAQAQGTRLSSWRQPVNPEIKSSYISNFLDLITLSELFEEKKDAVCLQMKFPWSINPLAAFLRYWKWIVLTACVVPPIVYPYCTGWCDQFPFSVYLISYVITLVFVLDLIFKLFTAVTTKQKTITQIGPILRHNFSKPSFYLDILAAIPMQIYILFAVDIYTAKAHVIGLLLHPSILKFYIYLKIGLHPGPHMVLLSVLKHTVTYSLALYLLAELVQLENKEVLAKECPLWIERYISSKIDREFLKNYMVAVFGAMAMAISAPSSLIYADTDFDLVVVTLSRFAFFFLILFYMNAVYKSVIVSNYSMKSFKDRQEWILGFLSSKNFSERTSSKIMSNVRFQWNYNQGETLSNEVSIFNALPQNLRREVLFETAYKTLQSSAFFQMESSEFALDVLENSELIAMPKGLLVLKYGQISHSLIIINRGYCQVNSHLTKDITASIGRAMVTGPGGLFPLLSSLCSIPSPLSVVTITDCEFIMISINTLLTLMMKHNIFKDLVDVITELNMATKLADTKPALVKLTGGSKVEEKKRSVTSRRLRHFFEALCPWLAKRSLGRLKFLHIWEAIYVFFLAVECICWPCCFGVFLLQSHIIIPLLTALKILLLVQIVIHSFYPYYDKNGLLIQHPRRTFIHYVRGTFILDFLRSVPLFPIFYYCICDPYEKPSIGFVVILLLQEILNVIYIMGYFNFVGYESLGGYKTWLIKVCILCTVTFNLYVNFVMYLLASWEYGGPYKVVGFRVRKENDIPEMIGRNSTFDYYAVIVYWVLTSLTTNEFEIVVLRKFMLYTTYFQYFLGTLMGYFFIVAFCGSPRLLTVRGAKFVEEFNHFRKYLKKSEVDEKMIKFVDVFYDYFWLKTQGEDFQGAFGNLPHYLAEELWYPMYRPTFIMNGVFENADEGFFRILSTEVTSVFFTRGSLIIFEGQVQDYIYFVHRGKCFVYDWFMILDIGSMIGDIKLTGVMKNRVYALTNVEMLRIPSENFYTIINNYYLLEANFLHILKKSESFIKSDVYRDYHPLRTVASTEAVNAFSLRRKEIMFENESFFEDAGNQRMFAYKKFKYASKKRRQWLVYPHWWSVKIFAYICYISIIVTEASVLVFSTFGGLTDTVFIIFGVLDGIYLLFVIMKFRMAVMDVNNGAYITESRLIAKKYLFNGFIFDAISLIPLEVIAVAIVGGRRNVQSSLFGFLRASRVLRLYTFDKYRKEEFGMVKKKVFKNCIKSVKAYWFGLVFWSIFYMFLSEQPDVKAAVNAFELSEVQLKGFMIAFSYVLNYNASVNLHVLTPTTIKELWHFYFSVIVLDFLKIRMVNSILSLIHFKSLNQSHYKSQVSRFEDFLKKRDTSPIIVKRSIQYKMDIYDLTHCKNEWFLLTAPMFIRLPLMAELFIHHLEAFPPFQDVDKDFLKQLIARTKREIFFPGQKIVQQGDVDQRFFFIHSGEVYVISQTKELAYTEYVIGKKKTGEYFGEGQGFWVIRPHPNTYRGRTVVEIITLRLSDWEDLRKCFPDVTLKIFARAKALKFV